MHKNARLTFARRIEMVQEMTEHGTRLSTAATTHEGGADLAPGG